MKEKGIFSMANIKILAGKLHFSRLVFFLTVVVLFCSLFLFVKGINSLVSGSESSCLKDEADYSRRANPARTSVNISLDAYKLFGGGGESSREKAIFKKKKVVSGQLQEIVKDLILKGTVVGKVHFAIIENVKHNDVNFYHLGDEIEGATVSEIGRKKVLLTLKGAEAELTLNKDFFEEIENNVLEMAEVLREAKIEDLEEYVDDFYTIPASVLSLVEIQEEFLKVEIKPLFAGFNRIDGIRIISLNDESILKEYGLKENDIIKAVGGIKITSLDKLAKVKERLIEQKKAVVQIMRGNRSVCYHYTLQ